MQHQELESTFISDGNGKSALKWFICLQTQDRPVAVSLLMHECGGAALAQALCTDEEEEAGDSAAGRTRAQKQSRISKSAVAPPSDRIKHVLV